MPAKDAIVAFTSIALSDPAFRAFYNPFAFQGTGGIVIGKSVKPYRGRGWTNEGSQAMIRDWTRDEEGEALGRIAIASEELIDRHPAATRGKKGGVRGVAHVQRNGRIQQMPAAAAATMLGRELISHDDIIRVTPRYVHGLNGGMFGVSVLPQPPPEDYLEEGIEEE